MNGAEYIFNSYPDLKKVAFFHSHTLWPSHFETELELMELLSKNDISLVSYVCNDELEQCDLNPGSDLNECAKCIKTRYKGFGLLKTKSIEIPIVLKKRELLINEDLSIDELKKVTYNSFDVGYAVLSTIISRCRDPYLTIKKYHHEFQTTINKSVALYDFFLKSLPQVKPDMVIIFNGRYAYARALVRACEKLRIPYYTHERGANLNKYMLFPNTLPHDLDFFHQSMHQSWKNEEVTETDKIKQANAFYHDRAEGKEQNWFSFIDNQKKDLLPDNWVENVYNIAIFLSSEDEFIAIGDQWESGLFKNQLQGLQYIVKNTPYSNSIHFYIRIHPNSENALEFIENLNLLNSGMVTVILPQSPVSTYKLMFSSDKVISFGSTVGIEATYWGKPSINLGNCFYKSLAATYNPTNKEEIIDLILNKKLEPCEKYSTYLYAYHASTLGYDFEIYAPTALKEGTFKSVNLQKTKKLTSHYYSDYIKWPYRLKYFLKRIEKRIRYIIRIKLLKTYD